MYTRSEMAESGPTREHKLFVWDISHFSGKARGYMRYKRIPHYEASMNFMDYLVRAKIRGGDRTIPVVVTPDGEWIQDTKVIVDTLEQRYPERPVKPETPVQRFAAYLLELWGDEVLVQMSVHTRWSYVENYPRFRDEVGPKMFPRAPRALQNLVASEFRRFMTQRARGFLGIQGDQIPVLDAWMERMLDALQEHFAAHDYLLGGRPCIADFALLGTMCGHLSQDPWPRRNLIEPRPALLAWIDRMSSPPESVGELYPDDELPPTLEPVIRDIVEGLLPLLVKTVEHHVERYGGQRTRMPRGTSKRFSMRREGTDYRISGQAIHLWMVQRVLDDLMSRPAPDQAKVREWLRGLGAEDFLDLSIPRTERAGLSARFV